MHSDMAFKDFSHIRWLSRNNSISGRTSFKTNTMYTLGVKSKGRLNSKELEWGIKKQKVVPEKLQKLDIFFFAKLETRPAPCSSGII